MPTKSETVLQALFAVLNTGKPPGSVLLRNSVLPERVPAAGIAILRDGEPGEPEVLLSPTLYIYEHRADLELVVDLATPALRDAAFDAWKTAVGAVLASNRSLGGLCDYVQGEAPSPVDIAGEGSDGMKAATLGIVLTYQTSDPLF